MASHTPLIIPVENQARELDAKLLLACIAAERGFPVVLGARLALYEIIDRLPPGLFLAKDLKPGSRRIVRLLQQLGYSIVSLDEEGMVVVSPSHYWETRLDPETLGRVCLQLAWGEEEADVLRGFPSHPGTPIRVTGNPRTDLLRPELRGLFGPEAATLRDRFGDFVLVNTNFGAINPFFPSLERASAAARSARKANPLFDMADYKLHRKQVYEHFKRAVPRIAEAFPELQVVLRPHPSESHEIWREILAPYSNAHVIFEGGVMPWLLASRVLVHNGCTTAVEAALLERPTLSFAPVHSEGHEIELPTQLSHGVVTLDALLECIGEGTREGGDASRFVASRDPAKRALLERHMAGLEGPLASERVASELERFDAERSHRLPPALVRVAARVGVRARTLEKRLIALVPGSKHDQRYSRHRFPGVELAEVEARIERLGGMLGRFKDLRVAELAANVFRFEA